MKLSSKVHELTEIIAPAVNACGVVLWGIEFMPQGRRSLLRIYIEKDEAARQNGEHITIEDCTAVNHQVSGILDVHDPIAGEYVLEVSSPGFDRPLFTSAQICQYVGQIINLRLILAIDGKRRKITGLLDSIDDDYIYITSEDKQNFKIALNNIDKANLVYQD